MIQVSRANDADRDQWDDFVAASPAAEAYHPYAWRDVLENTFDHRCIYLTAKDNNGDLTGVLPLAQLKSRLFGNFLVSLPCFNYCGILATNEASRTALADAAWQTAQELGAAHVELRHDQDVELPLPFRDDKVAMRLTLPETSEALWAQFSSKLRAQVRRPTKSGAECTDGGLELLDEFYAVFSRNMRDLGTPVYPKKLFESMYAAFPEKTRFFVVRIADKPCAAGITYGFRDRLEIPSASSLREYNRESVNMLLYWSVLQYAIEKGHRVFDFGRSSRDAGTFRFKKQWGAEPVQLHWHYCQPSGAELPALNPQNSKFKLATSMWQRLPLPIANRLGPHIIRNLP